MADLEQVLSRIAILRTWAMVNPEYGMGLNIDECRKAVEWLDDAFAMLTLLKEQYPRVMALDELDDLDDLRGRGLTVFYENRDAMGQNQDVFFIYTSNDFGCDDGFAWFKGETITFPKDINNYGVKWRCWTRRPTEEQRRAEPWKG